MQMFKKSILVYAGVLVVLGVFVLGWGLGNNSSGEGISIGFTKTVEPGEVEGMNEAPPAWLEGDVEFEIFWDVWQKIQKDYVDSPIPDKQLFYGAIHGLVGSLEDPFSLFLEPQASADFNEELKGRFEGIGAEIGIKSERLTIITPLPDSPAEQAGLRGGDKVYKIDDFDTTGINIIDAVDRIRGEKGTPVTLSVRRGEEIELRDITIIRDTIRIVSVRHEIKHTPGGKKVAYIKVTNFHDDTSGRFRKAVTELLAQGPDAFVVDMRNNPGGFLNTAIELASYWVPINDVVVMQKYSEDNIETSLSPGSGELFGFETIVLINGGSASASEIFAGALKDHDIATLVGEKTFGKGSVQDLTELADGSSVKLTIAKWLTPDGIEIDKEGILADVEIEHTEEDYNADIDTPLIKALELLDQ